MVGHGKGGTIDKMQVFNTADLIVYTIPESHQLPVSWVATGTGVIKADYPLLLNEWQLSY